MKRKSSPSFTFNRPSRRIPYLIQRFFFGTMIHWNYFSYFSRTYSETASTPQKKTFERTPITMKDRIPFPGTMTHDGRLKLAILVDAISVSPESYPYIDELVKKKGTICLRRYFDYECRPFWKALENSFSFEWFRVDGFIPIHMQIAADTAHLIEYKKENLISGIVMVVTMDEAEAYSKYYERFKGSGVSLFICHEKEIYKSFVEI